MRLHAYVRPSFLTPQDSNQVLEVHKPANFWVEGRVPETVTIPALTYATERNARGAALPKENGKFYVRGKVIKSYLRGFPCWTTVLKRLE